ncbi:DUF3592 domain-containing protein [Hymenobacter cellulosilyticus]|uniref:DUF3592 domain-containing protein n=1 Tax=Hymenobacter cellulosilyticus TaxID=2932248 RepID=A0A8T9Q177_9BACT|nr:DUF3592 domain-containing protein [Hymenobacter cellulosilyticus]UOQ71506.1 DUF3592 domain-containing protein [Hymenobacter cellulosilyticus]
MSLSLVSVGAMGMGALMLYDALRNQRHRLRMRRIGRPATATIVERHWDEKHEYTYSLVRFYSPTHGWITARPSQAHDVHHASIGAQVPILYHPTQPHQVIIGSQSLASGTVALVLIGLGIIVYGLWLTFSDIGPRQPTAEDDVTPAWQSAPAVPCARKGEAGTLARLAAHSNARLPRSLPHHKKKPRPYRPGLLLASLQSSCA